MQAEFWQYTHYNIILYDIDFVITPDYRILWHACRIQKQLIHFSRAQNDFNIIILHWPHYRISNVWWFMNDCYTMGTWLQVLRRCIIHSILEKINNIVISLSSYFYIIIYSKIIRMTGKNRRHHYSTRWCVIIYVRT